ncbi:cytochrome c biogenesis protein CcdA [Aquifex sp.]
MEVTLLGAFLAGLLSFLSPCVLPIVPAYLSYISGVSTAELEREQRLINLKVFFSSLFFVVGFSIVFVALGASATFIGNLLQEYQDWIRIVGSGLVIFFGLHFAGVFFWKHFPKALGASGVLIPLLYFTKLINRDEALGLLVAYGIVVFLYLIKAHEFLYRQLKIEAKAEVSYLGALLMGVVFAFGWSPCIGPVLGSILMLASQQETVGQGALLLLVYSVGLGLPFLIAGLLFSAFLNFVRSFSRFFKYVEIVGGVLLVALGLLLALDKLSLIANITF